MGYLSETTRRRIAAGILVAGLVLAILAITDSAFFEDPPTESERITTVVEAFFDAAAEGDFERNCELLTREAQDAMRQAAARLEGATDERLGCVAILETVMGDTFAKVSVRVRPGVSISGNRARAEAVLRPEGEPSRFRTILLELSDEGDWLISDFG